MKKSEIIDALASKTGLTKADVTKVYEATFELFRNPQTGKAIKISASKSVRFKVAKALKDSLNK